MFRITFTISQSFVTLVVLLPQILEGHSDLRAMCGGRVWLYFGETRMGDVEDEAYKFLTQSADRTRVRILMTVRHAKCELLKELI